MSNIYSLLSFLILTPLAVPNISSISSIKNQVAIFDFLSFIYALCCGSGICEKGAGDEMGLPGCSGAMRHCLGMRIWGSIDCRIVPVVIERRRYEEETGCGSA